jgi:hypothetical protein
VWRRDTPKLRKRKQSYDPYGEFQLVLHQSHWGTRLFLRICVSELWIQMRMRIRQETKFYEHYALFSCGNRMGCGSLYGRDSEFQWMQTWPEWVSVREWTPWENKSWNWQVIFIDELRSDSVRLTYQNVEEKREEASGNIDVESKYVKDHLGTQRMK